jgi:tetratricopeptide (TPR) repeat protein
MGVWPSLLALVAWLSAAPALAGETAESPPDAMAAGVDSPDAPTPVAADATESGAVAEPDAPDPALAALQQGWAALNDGRYDDAAAAYAQASALDPTMLDAWLGLQWAHLAAGRAQQAAAAGERALALDPHSFWARRRQALARYLLGEYAAARGLYESVLADDPTDAEVRLGLGFTLVRLGEVDQGHAECRKAAPGLKEGGLVAECLALGALAGPLAAPAVTVGGGAWLTLLTPAGKTGLFQRQQTLTATAFAEWPAGWGVWGGALVGQMITRPAQTASSQDVPVLGAYGRWRDLSFAASVARLSSDEADADGAWVRVARAAWQPGAWGVSLGGAWTGYAQGRVWQADPRVVWQPSSSLRLAAGAEIVGLDPDAGAAMPADTLTAWQIEGRWQTTDTLAVDAWGSWGPRQRFVEVEGLAVWSNDDRFTWGARTGLTWQMTPSTALRLEGRWEAGEVLAGQTRDFTLVGGTAGLQLTY